MKETRKFLGEQIDFDYLTTKVYKTYDGRYEVEAWIEGKLENTYGPYTLVELSDTFADELEFDKYGLTYTPSFTSYNIKNE